MSLCICLRSAELRVRSLPLSLMQIKLSKAEKLCS